MNLKNNVVKSKLGQTPQVGNIQYHSVTHHQIQVSLVPQWWVHNNPVSELHYYFELAIEGLFVTTPLWAKCEGEAHTPKSGNLESSGTPENLELELKGQNTLHWGVLDVIAKVLKCRCLNWPRIGHLDICSPSHGQKKGRESNWQFDSRPLKVGNRPLLDVCSKNTTWRWKALEENYNIGSNLAPIGLGSREIWAPKVPGLQLGSPGKKSHLDVASTESYR